MFKFKHKSKYKAPNPKLKTPAQVVDTIVTMKKCGVREMAWDWRDIKLGKVKRSTLIKICRKYGKVRRKWYGFSIRFNV